MKAKFKVIPNGENYDIKFFSLGDNQIYAPIKPRLTDIPEGKLDDAVDEFKESHNCTELTQIL